MPHVTQALLQECGKIKMDFLYNSSQRKIDVKVKLLPATLVGAFAEELAAAMAWRRVTNTTFMMTQDNQFASDAARSLGLPKQMLRGVVRGVRTVDTVEIPSGAEFELRLALVQGWVTLGVPIQRSTKHTSKTA